MSTGGVDGRGSANQTGAGCVASQQVALTRDGVFEKDDITLSSNVKWCGTTTNLFPFVSPDPGDRLGIDSRPLPPGKCGPLRCDLMKCNTHWIRILLDHIFQTPALDASDERLAASDVRRVGVLMLTGTETWAEINKYVDTAATGEYEAIFGRCGSPLQTREFLTQLPLDAATLALVGAGEADFGSSLSCMPRLLVHVRETQKREVRRSSTVV